MPFDPKKFLAEETPKAAFDPKKFLAEDLPKAAFDPKAFLKKYSPTVTGLESGLRGLAQGASLGFADELTGGLEAASDTVFGGRKLSDFGDTYKVRRDESREQYKGAQEANPGIYQGAEIGGAIGTAFVPGLGMLNAAKGAQLGAVVGKGALQGALTGLGGTEEEGVGGQALDTLKGTALGAGGGAAGFGLGKAVGGVTDSLADSKVGQYLLSKYKGGASGVANSMEDFAELQGARALGLERATQKKMGRDATRAVGRQALDEDILSFGANTSDLVARNEAVKKGAMADRAAAYRVIDDAGASQLNPTDIARSVAKKVLSDKDKNLMNPQYKDTQELMEKLRPEIENILSRGDDNISMADGQRLVESLNVKSKFDKTRTNAAQDMARDIYFSVRESVNEAAERAGSAMDKRGGTRIGESGAALPTTLRETIEGANKKFSIGKNTETLLRNKAAREEGNKLFSLTDNIATSSLSMLAIPFVAAKKISEKYGNQTAAITTDKLSKFIRETPEMLGKYRPALEKAIQRGGTAVAVTHQLLQSKDPEYRKIISGEDEGE